MPAYGIGEKAAILIKEDVKQQPDAWDDAPRIMISCS